MVYDVFRYTYLEHLNSLDQMSKVNEDALIKEDDETELPVLALREDTNYQFSPESEPEIETKLKEIADTGARIVNTTINSADMKVKAKLVNSKPKCLMIMLSYQGTQYVEVSRKVVDTSQSDSFSMFNKKGMYRIDLEAKGAISHYTNGMPVCYYDIRYDLPLYSGWKYYKEAKSSKFAGTIYAQNTLEIVLKVAKQNASTQWINILIGCAIGLPIGMIIGNALHLTI